MSEQAPTSETDTRQMGIAELSTLSVLERGWEQVTIEQRGPDGSEVIAILLFWVCPICRAVCPSPTEDHPFTADHAGFHLKQARDFDVLNDLLGNLTEGSSPPTEGD